MSLERMLIAATVLVVAQGAAAYEVLSALVPQNDGLYALVTLHNKACDPNSGNASINNTQISQKGCWTLDGDLIRIQLSDSSEARVFPRQEFKRMGEITQIAQPAPKVSTTTNLTCVADAWAGDIVVERNIDGSLKSVFVSGDKVDASEQANTLSFSYKGLSIGLSTLTGVFNYDTSGFQSYLNNRFLGRGSAKGVGKCIVNASSKKF